jgi:hypothetical protein
MADTEHDRADPHLPRGRRFSRREILALGASIGAATVFPGAQSFATASAIPARPIPRTGERLPIVGVGTAIVFDIGEDAVRRGERAKVIQTLLEGGGRVIDTAPSYGTAEVVVGDLLALPVCATKFSSRPKSALRRDTAIAEMQGSSAPARGGDRPHADPQSRRRHGRDRRAARAAA